jgi:hypothetical protein
MVKNGLFFQKFLFITDGIPLTLISKSSVNTWEGTQILFLGVETQELLMELPLVLRLTK